VKRKVEPAVPSPFEPGSDEPLYTSGVVCRLLEIPVWVLKQLDRESVVSPPRRKGRSRLYSKNELTKLRHVWYYMNINKVNVHGVKVILEMEERHESEG
jgi:MerR family transcriptional regulator, heat shock protein HspR